MREAEEERAQRGQLYIRESPSEKPTAVVDAIICGLERFRPMKLHSKHEGSKSLSAGVCPLARQKEVWYNAQQFLFCVRHEWPSEAELLIESATESGAIEASVLPEYPRAVARVM